MDNDEEDYHPILNSLGGWISTTTVTSTTTTRYWNFWNNIIANETASINTWAHWNYNMVGTYYNTAVRFVEMDAEAQRQREIRNQRLREEEFRISAEKIVAKEKAEKLLQSALTNEQREELKTKGFFHCKSRIGVVYRIYRGSHGNVRRIGANGKEIERLCVQPHYVPEGDCMLAQKLHIENCEEEFRRTANITLLN